MRHILQGVLRFIGFGKRCSSCGRLKSTTRFTLRNKKTEELLQQYLVCDACAIKGVLVEFTFDDGIGDFADVGKKERRQRVKISKKLETELALDIGGKVQPGSGNKDEKADVRVMGEWRMEHKYTDSVSGYRLSVSDLNAIIRHANAAGEVAAMIVVFRKLEKRKFAIIPYENFLETKAIIHEFNKNRRSK